MNLEANRFALHSICLKRTSLLAMINRISLVFILIICILKEGNAFLPAPLLSIQRHTLRSDKLFIENGIGRQLLRPQSLAKAMAGSDDSTTSSSDVFEQCRQKLRGTCVYFIGMMGSGKSTLGDAFAKKMGYRFLDTDEIAEFMIDMPIADYFAQGQGKVDEFRQLEYQILMELAQYTRVVVATGGGIVVKNENWGLLRHGIVVFVDVDPEDIYARLKADPAQIAKRPLLREADPLVILQQLSAERSEKYLQADVHLKLSGEPRTPDQLAETAAQAILDFIISNPPLWESWKKKRESVAVEAAGRLNPSATAASGVGFGEEKAKGSIKYVSLSDLQSGKVQIPTSQQDLDDIEGDLPPAFQ